MLFDLVIVLLLLTVSEYTSPYANYQRLASDSRLAALLQTNI